MADEFKLIKKRSSLKAKLTTFTNYLDIVSSCQSLSELQRLELQSRFAKIDALYEDFDNLQTEIESLDTSVAKVEEAYVARQQFEDLYHPLVARARSLLASVAPSEQIFECAVSGGAASMQVKAVHLELVTDLTKESYMAALNRFVSRRGKPRNILSDNGTNFVGTSNELQRFLHSSNVASDMVQEGIQFSFAPPYSPHFNGLAEAVVRSTKHHLKRLLKLTHLTYEEMSTCLTQIEAILNSRPLTPLSSDPCDYSALTPAHLLIGRPLTSIPHPQVADVNITRLDRYHRIEHIKQHFWRRFNIEYVSMLQQKTKWSTSSGNLVLGTLVLIKDKLLPPLLWSLGRVVQVYPGSDGVTRVVEVKTKNGTIRRAFNNVCPLPLH
ncbi:uncharacterized protein LOC131855010 isoform X7 [Achroia grisella]|uniref:uncharacterized protein LOC131844909 isoform X8 n=1 Tax=Achroia grisella TaxID=688607 RepID=UPI0027D251B8|nr:uncharacterized protein LOC131844909 isoform X8 [Achroia grisella]XP_059061035.1 uncharacterized protein LOC131853955 isoform X9 [Achroia grisella]XP_059062205.1 uncharacterized protein LOC131855010 isoform X7 [Achroia grisella]